MPHSIDRPPRLPLPLAAPVLAALVLALLLASPASAIITTFDSSGAQILAPSLFDGVALITAAGIGCSGALLSDGQHVLTAAHCVFAALPAQATVSFYGSGGVLNYGVSSIVVNPAFVSNGQNVALGADIAVLQLAASADPGLHRYGIYTQTNEFGQQFIMAGYGYPGAGATGGTSGFGVLRSGTNVFDVDPFFFVGNSVVNFGAYLMFDFDNGLAAQNVTGGLGTGTTEAMLGPGDSGGPSFLLVNGNLTIAGVHSWGGRLVDGGGISSDIDGIINGTFGEVGGDTRVSTYAAFIADTVNAPEPGAGVLVAAALALIGAMARKRVGKTRLTARGKSSKAPRAFQAVHSAADFRSFSASSRAGSSGVKGDSR